MTPEQLRNKRWRLQNLYSIKDAETGKVVPFRPRNEQMEIFDALLTGVRKIIILKARRLGMSTAIDVFAADECIFNEGVQISIVDRKQDDATKKLNGICKIAYQSLPPEIRNRIVEIRTNDSSWELALVNGDSKSAIYAGMNARGGTNQLLHISEWGVIQADDPTRSEEILTGAIPSAEHGVTIVETTWKGGRGGHLWSLVEESMKLPEGERTPNDWHLYFFPWYNDPTYTEPGNVAGISQETAEYLADKEKETGYRFTNGQRCWYDRRRKTLGVFIYREFPTTIDECFKSPMDGAIYADLIDKLRAAGAIRPAAVDGSALVHTFWDLGSPLNTVTWYAQFIAGEIRIIDVDMTYKDNPLDLTIVERSARILNKGYNYGFHYLPHDAAQTKHNGRTFQTELNAVGIVNTRVIPRTHDIWIGINNLREIMPRMTFRTPACDPGIEALSNYHTKRESSGGIAQDIPVHDWSSHAADGLRMLAEAVKAGMIIGDSAVAKKARKRPSGGAIMGIRDPMVSGQTPRPRARMWE